MVDRSILRAGEQRNQANHKSKRFMRWTTCFAFVSKFKKPVTNARLQSRKENTSKICDTATDQVERMNLERVSDEDEEDIDKKSIEETPFPREESILSTSTSPVSALSPPPRHAMKERSRSMTPDMPMFRPPSLDTFPKKTATLRLSLDIEQHYPAMLHSSSSFMLAGGDVKLGQDSSGSSVATCSSLTIHHSSDQKLDPSPDPPSIVDTPPSPLLLPSPPPDAIRRDRHQSMPILKRRNATNTTLQIEDEDEYRNILDQFQLPLPIDTADDTTHHVSSTKKESKEQNSVLPLYTTGSRSMDIGRDKAFYDAVVAGTIHRRPWTHFLRPQQMNSQSQKRDDEVEEDRFVYYPPSPNSINAPYALDK